MQQVSTLPPQVINYDTDLPAHYTLSATFNFHDVSLNDQEQAALKIIWNECVFCVAPCAVSILQLLFRSSCTMCVAAVRSRWHLGIV